MEQEVFFENIQFQIIKNLKECKSELKIAVAWFTDKRIINVVNELINKNIDIEIIVYDDHINKKDLFEKLYYNNAKIYLSRKLMHNKFCVIDNKTVINGSYNWTYNASSNEENIQITYNNHEFSKKFITQFQKLKASCKSIEYFFEYSVSNLKSINVEFEDYYIQKKQLSFPYFYSTIEIEKSEVNKKSGIIDKGYYLVQNENEERELFRAVYFLNSKYSLINIYRILNIKPTFPLYFENIPELKVNESKIYVIDKDKYKATKKKRSALIFIDENKIERSCSLAEKDVWKYELGGKELYRIPRGYFNDQIKPRHGENHFYVKIEKRNNYDLFFINQKGEKISESLNYTHRLPRGLFFDGISKSIIDVNLKIYPLRMENIKFIEELGFVGKGFEKRFSEEKTKNGYDEHSKYGLKGFDNKIIINFEFGDYKFSSEKGELIFIEYPILRIYENVSGKMVVGPVWNSTNVSTKHFKFNSKENKLELQNNQNNYQKQYIFLSDDERLRKFHLALRHNTNAGLFRNALEEKKYYEIRERYLQGYNYSKYGYDTWDFIEKQHTVYSDYLTNLKKQEKACYVATMVYEDNNHPNIIILRNFRDETLKKYIAGQNFIKFYYKYSPQFVSYSSKKNIVKKLMKRVVDLVVCLIKKWNTM